MTRNIYHSGILGLAFLSLLFFISCKDNTAKPEDQKKIDGSWELRKAIVVSGDSTITLLPGKDISYSYPFFNTDGTYEEIIFPPNQVRDVELKKGTWTAKSGKVTINYTSGGSDSLSYEFKGDTLVATRALKLEEGPTVTATIRYNKSEFKADESIVGNWELTNTLISDDNGMQETTPDSTGIHETQTFLQTGYYHLEIDNKGTPETYEGTWKANATVLYVKSNSTKDSGVYTWEFNEGDKSKLVLTYYYNDNTRGQVFVVRFYSKK